MKQCPVCKTKVQDDVTLCPLCHTRVTSPITAQQIFYKKSFNPGILRVDLGILQRKFLALPAESHHIDHRFSRKQHKKTGHISTLGLLIKITIVLQETQVLPPWLINGLH